MKTYTKLFMFTLLLGLISCTRYKLLPVPPKAADLSDHFGTEPAANDYGPKVQVSPLLARQGVTGPGTPITPITNFYQEINPNEVVAGNLTNTAHDAGRIITPEMAGELYLFNFNST